MRSREDYKGEGTVARKVVIMQKSPEINDVAPVIGDDYTHLQTWQTKKQRRSGEAETG